MAYGIEVFDPAGELVFDTNKKGWVYIDTFDAAAGSLATVTYSAYAGRTIIAYAVTEAAAGGHIVTVSGVTVTASPITIDATTASMMGIATTLASKIHVFVR